MSPAPYVPILLYHSVSDTPSPSLARFTVSAGRFDDHMAYIADGGYTALSIDQLLSARADGGGVLPDRPVVITFDDGLADFSTTAWPTIRRHGLTATMYVVSGVLGGSSVWLPDLLPMLTPRDTSDLADDGCEIGAHTESHPSLDVLARGRAAEEITRSKSTLEDTIGRPVTTFAYPFGHHHAASRRSVIDAGFRSACAVKNKLSVTDDDPFALARVTITSDVDTSDLARILDGTTVDVVEPGERWKTSGYRQIRRARSAVSKRRQRRSGGHR